MDFLGGFFVGLALVGVVIAVVRLLPNGSIWAKASSSGSGRRPAGALPATPAAPSTPSAGSAPGRVPGHRFDAVAPDRLPTFASVGGMDDIKQELRDTIGLLLAHPDRAREYHITWNGLLLHGPPGVGKSFFVRALAGEFGLSLVAIATADLAASTGQSAQLLDAAFAFAREHLPCVLFFDELDSIAEDRNAFPDPDARDLLTQLLQSIEQSRDERRLLVAAATNDLNALDAAVIRPGRFDRHVRVDLPDDTGRRAIFAAHLEGRPLAKELDYEELSARTKGRTPAAIAQACEAAALAAFRESIGTDKVVRIAMKHLTQGLEHGAGEDRPTVEDWSWDRIVLAPRTLAELQEVQGLVEDPTLADRLGVDPPTGLLLTGPPGTGKTTIAKVLAAEADCSFYPVSAAEVTSKWVGESERAIARLFHRARANAPSIIFIDEIDAIGGSRGELDAYDRQLDQLLSEMDGICTTPGVLVVAATNRRAAIDPALLRGGRLSRVIEVGLPDRDQRLALLGLLTARMPLRGVDLDTVAEDTEGFSGADLKGLCQQAAIEAMVRRRAASGPRASARVHVMADDFERALGAGEETVAARAEASGRGVRRRFGRSSQ